MINQCYSQYVMNCKKKLDDSEPAQNVDAMPTQPQEILKKLDGLCIEYTLYEHEAVFTVAESHKVDAQIPAHHTRNMFLRTKKKENILVTLSHDTPIDLKKLEGVLGFKRFSFGSPDRLMEFLGVFPGSVTPLSVINANPDELTIILEDKMMQADLVAFHPLINTMTVTMAPQDLLKFMDSVGHTPRIVDLSPANP
jgi:Ala-tRNA(Pro) deacylase